MSDQDETKPNAAETKQADPEAPEPFDDTFKRYRSELSKWSRHALAAELAILIMTYGHVLGDLRFENVLAGVKGWEPTAKSLRLLKRIESFEKRRAADPDGWCKKKPKRRRRNRRTK